MVIALPSRQACKLADPVGARTLVPQVFADVDVQGGIVPRTVSKLQKILPPGLAPGSLG